MLIDILCRVRALFRGGAVERELDEELRAHVDRETDKYIAAGMSHSDAERTARLALGGVEQVKEQCRDARGIRMVDELVQDLRFAFRTLGKNRGFTVAAVTSLALGIGANTAVFSLIDATMLKPLPVSDPDRLLELLTDRGGSGPPGNAFSYQALTHFRDHATTLEAVIASHSSRVFVVVGSAPPDIADGQYVTGNFFRVLGVGAALGRTVEPFDDRPHAVSVAMLSHAYWQRRFGGDPQVVGRPITIDDRPFTIIGVAPPAFHGLTVGRAVDVWIPLAAEPMLRTPSWTSSAGYKWLQLVGRLQPETTFEQARAELETIFRASVIEAEVAMQRARRPDYQAPNWRLSLAPARAGLSMVRQQYGEPLLVLLAVSGIVLVIACVNVANLLLARARVRRPEIAMRVSLGAARSRIVRQLITESLVLASVGAAIGVVFAYAGSSYLVGFLATGRTPMALDVGPDLRLLTFAALLAIVMGILFGLAPAWRITGDVSGVSLLGSGRVRGSRDRRALSRTLISGQVALSVIMLFGAGLFLRSLNNLRSIETGFDSTSVLLISTDASRSRLGPDGRRTAFREAVARLRAIPGVQAASMADVTPIWGGGTTRTLEFRDADGGVREARDLYLAWVSPDYFATMKMPTYAGRDFTWQDTASSPRVAVINQAAARQHFGAKNPIGRFVGKDNERYEIVGVVGDAKYLDLREDIPPTLYLHLFQQEPADRIGGQFAIRTAGDPLAVVAAVREEIRAVVPSVPITGVRTLAQQIDESILRERMLGVLSGFFAALGLLLAAVGLYGVMSYSVSQRTSEIGIRIAVGAQPSQIAAMVVREALIMIAAGVAVGVGGALLLSRSVDALLFGVTPRDPLTLSGVVMVMILTGLIAAYLPCRRAAHVEPTQALRME